MEIVINIPDKAFKDLQFFKDESLSRPEIAVKYGTPLPKGHGRLKDVDWDEQKMWDLIKQAMKEEKNKEANDG